MYENYKVQTGYTLDSIANKYGTTQALLLQINGLPDSYTPLPNSEIIVPLNPIFDTFIKKCLLDLIKSSFLCIWYCVLNTYVI